MQNSSISVYNALLQGIPKKSNVHDFFMNFEPENFSSNNEPYRGNLMQGIDCAHFRSVKTLP
jgi:hypothetical protein